MIWTCGRWKTGKWWLEKLQSDKAEIADISDISDISHISHISHKSDVSDTSDIQWEMKSVRWFVEIGKSEIG